METIIRSTPINQLRVFVRFYDAIERTGTLNGFEEGPAGMLLAKKGWIQKNGRNGSKQLWKANDKLFTRDHVILMKTIIKEFNAPMKLRMPSLPLGAKKILKSLIIGEPVEITPENKMYIDHLFEQGFITDKEKPKLPIDVFDKPDVWDLDYYINTEQEELVRLKIGLGG